MPSSSSKKKKSSKKSKSKSSSGGSNRSKTEHISTGPDTESKRFWEIEHADAIRLMEAYMLEHGLTKSARTLREESGIGLRGATHSNLGPWALTGQWGNVLQTMYLLDDCSKATAAASDGEDTMLLKHQRKQHKQLLSDVHELAILDAAVQGDFDVAYAILKVCQQQTDLFELPEASADDASSSTKKKAADNAIPRYRLLEQRLAAYAAAGAGKEQPKDFFGTAMTQQQRRLQVAQRLSKIPRIPANRLMQLLQHATKWQTYTANWPKTRAELYPMGDDEDGGVDNDGSDEQEANKASPTKSKKRKITDRVDLVMGEVDYEWIVGSKELDDDMDHDDADGTNKSSKASKAKHHKRRKREKIPLDPWSTVKFGKGATCESSIFLPDASALVTGSSDGLVELWDPSSKFTELRMDLRYQKDEELLGHDSAVTALAISRDSALLATGDKQGYVKVWRIDNGKCLRKFQAHDHGIASLAFNPSGTRVLSAGYDGIAREFGLRTSRMLKEFQGHIATITTAQYIVDRSSPAYDPTGDGDDDDSIDDNSPALQVVTGSSDGTLRLWSAHSADCLYVVQPAQHMLHPEKPSLVVDPSSLQDTKASVDCHAVLAVLPVNNPDAGSVKQGSGLIVVSRTHHAHFIDTRGNIKVTYKTEKPGQVMVAACLSNSQHSLFAATDDGDCLVFDVLAGTLEKTIRDFGMDTSASKTGKIPPEITTLQHHPHKGIMLAFSNDKSLKKGIATLWK